MPDLANDFSWSHSAAGDFESCRRKRFWSKYAAWGGWEPQASALSRSAYRLNKMTNRSALRGVAVELATMALLREHQAGRPADPSWAWNHIARPFLATAWNDSLSKAWLSAPKKTCLHEHYYPALSPLSDLDMKKEVAEDVNLCLENFVQHTLPRIRHITPEDEIPVLSPGKGLPENFEFDGFRVYAIPDFVYRSDGLVHIVDWKSGAPHPEHADQLRLYALWAGRKHGLLPSNLRLRLEYLALGQSLEVEASPDVFLLAEQRIRASVQDMAQYLQHNNLLENRPLPRDEWDLCYDPPTCRRCPFWELCQPELGDDFLLSQDPS